LLNGIPNDISIVAGIITTDFQTPLSHINVLSHNRGAPNMALRDGWTNPRLEALANKLVYLKVSLDTFELREASLEEAQAFWNIKDPVQEIRMHCDTTTTGLFNLSEANISSSSVIGGKAANLQN
jgi:pyruvate,water dikinase